MILLLYKMKYLVSNKNIPYSRITKLNQAEQWDIHQSKQSTDLRMNSYIEIKQNFEGQRFPLLTNRVLFGLSTIFIIMSFLLTVSDRTKYSL